MTQTLTILMMTGLLLSGSLTETTVCLAQAPVVRSEPIFEKAPFPSCHAATLAQTPRGIVAAWFGGTREKADDVEIYFASREDEQWTEPVSVANGVQHAGKRYPCWNPVLYQVPDGPLLLFYKVGPDPQNWWGEMKASTDHGRTWSDSHRLPEDVLGPVKNKPVLLNDGRLLCPSSREASDNGQDRWQVHLEVTEDWGTTWSLSPALETTTPLQAIQPSILQHPEGKLQLLCRSRQGRLATAWSDDQGKTWGPLELTPIPNPNSGTDAVTLQDGRHLLVYNPTTTIDGQWGGPRTPLSVAISRDGRHWTDIAVLEDQPGEYSYPAVIQSRDGRVHIVYTHQRKTIHYCMLDPKQFPAVPRD